MVDLGCWQQVKANCQFALYTKKKIQWCYCSTLHMKMYEVFLQCLVDIITNIGILFFACLKYFSMAYKLLMNSFLSIKRRLGRTVISNILVNYFIKHSWGRVLQGSLKIVSISITASLSWNAILKFTSLLLSRSKLLKLEILYFHQNFI